MANLPLILLLMDIKYGSALQLIPSGQDVVIRAGGHDIANMSYLAVELHFLEMQQDCFIIEGITSIPAVFGDGAGFLLIHNGQPHHCDLTDCGFDRMIGGWKYEKRWVFHAKIYPREGKNSIRFANVVQSGPKYVCPCGKINAMRFFPVSDCLESQYCFQNGFVFYLKQGTLFFETAAEKEREWYEGIYREKLSLIGTADAAWAVHLRNRYFAALKRKTKPIWLFMDRPDRADDNAEVLFRYVREDPEIDSYYILSRESPDYDRMEKLGHIVPLYSPQHELLVLLADYIVSSQSNGVVENPFWEKAEYVRDLYHQAGIIFLQHGVIKDDMSPTLNRFNTNFTGFITSSPAERDSILRGAYDYPEDKVWLTGLPRFDKLYNDPQKYLLIMPSWRKEFLEQTWDEECHDMRWKPVDGFADSMYVRRWRSLLGCRHLKESCDVFGYRILFLPHALMRPYVRDLTGEDAGDDRTYREIFAESSLMVTDYSSVAFDFAYLRKLILYYQFDRDDFFATHTYKRGYFDYERDGFGEVVSGEEELVDLLIDYMRNDCVVKEPYRSRMETVFAYWDVRACERVCACIRRDMDRRNQEKERAETGMEQTDGKDLLIRDLKSRISRIEEENEGLRNEAAALNLALEQTRYALDETRKSFTYRLGSALTSLPRRFCKIKCRFSQG
ncbi:MAG: CDP-glycerol glycerophosphotransferase family protein [Lachnospiraceae bacterium]|nr:CDP-glycerol glycerophosphotransferase family protein [Lachnospiraceae bacterium]